MSGAQQATTRHFFNSLKCISILVMIPIQKKKVAKYSYHFVGFSVWYEEHYTDSHTVLSFQKISPVHSYHAVPCNHRHVYLCCGCNHHQFGHTKERQTPLTGHWIGLIAHISITKDQTPNLTSVWTFWTTSFPSYSTTELYLPGVIKHTFSTICEYIKKLIFKLSIF